VTPTELPFEEVWLRDFEFVPRPGERPDVVCLAAHELRSGRTLRLWRDKLLAGAAQPPYRLDRDVLHVSFVANAECACYLALGWPLPARELDLSPAFRKLTNGRLTPEGKGLIGALRYFGLDAIGSKQKDATRERIMKGWPFTPEEKLKILDYCYSDVDALLRLLPKILADPDFDLGIALHHSEFVADSALMEHHGVPIDMEVFTQFADKKTWGAIRDAMVPKIDSKYGVYVRNAAGEWSFNMEKFTGYLEREGILAGWPKLESGKLNMRSKMLEEMGRSWPQLEELRQLRYVRNKLRKVKLAVGADGRNRTVLWPFKSKTSRTQPKAAEWIFSPAVWLRSLIKPGPGTAIAYVDWSSMEFLIAAALSDGHIGPVNRMLNMYLTRNPYLAFAKQVGAVPSDATKTTHPAEHHQYKIGLLAIQYGMACEMLAARLGITTFEAHLMIEQHHELFDQYWRWSDDWVQRALQTGTMRTAFGWHYRTGITEFNERSIRNWPVQATGADIMRIACILGTRHGIKILAPVHDAMLIEAPIDRIEADVALMREIMRRASRIVLNADAAGTLELRTDATIVRYPERYVDARGEGIWELVMGILDEQRGQRLRTA
jgi:DNA polymerase I